MAADIYAIVLSIVKAFKARLIILLVYIHSICLLDLKFFSCKVKMEFMSTYQHIFSFISLHKMLLLSLLTHVIAGYLYHYIFSYIRKS